MLRVWKLITKGACTFTSTSYVCLDKVGILLKVKLESLLLASKDDLGQTIIIKTIL